MRGDEIRWVELSGILNEFEWEVGWSWMRSDVGLEVDLGVREWFGEMFAKRGGGISQCCPTHKSIRRSGLLFSILALILKQVASGSDLIRLYCLVCAWSWAASLLNEENFPSAFLRGVWMRFNLKLIGEKKLYIPPSVSLLKSFWKVSTNHETVQRMLVWFRNESLSVKIDFVVD